MEPNDIEPGTEIIGFALQTPVVDELCRAQVASSLRRDLPDAICRRGLTVIANGPTAREVDLRMIQGDTLALNGALALFLKEGLAPTYWACCDPQALVADFLPYDPPTGTIYLVASKCHASVFEKLKGRDVRLWHIPDYPAEGRSHSVQASSVTISASWLMHHMGYTDFDYWGWDGCYFGSMHHATGGAADLPNSIKLTCHTKKDGVVVDTRVFVTTKTWAAENHSAEYFFQLALYFDMAVTLHGNGMFRYFQQPFIRVA